MEDIKPYPYINSIHIDKFFEFYNVSLEALGPSLNIFIGPNEAGKSTILKFLRAIFFGFDKKYPKDWGGRIEIISKSSTPIIIERKGGTKTGILKVLDQDGTLKGEEGISFFIRGINKTLFENCFAFSLDELQTISSLQHDQMQDALFAAASGTSQKAISRVKLYLENLEKELFKPRGQKPLINKLLKELTEVSSAISKVEDELKGVIHVEDTLKELKNERLEIQKRIESLRITEKRLELLDELWDKWINYNNVREELSKLEHLDTTIPEGVENLFSAVNSSIEDITLKINRVDRELRQLKERISSLELDSRITSNENVIEKILSRLQEAIGAKERFEEFSQRRNVLEERVERLRRDIGIDIDEDNIVNIDTSFIVRQKISSLYEAIDEGKKKIIDLERSFKDLESRSTILREKELPELKQRIEEIELLLKEFQGLKLEAEELSLTQKAIFRRLVSIEALLLMLFVILALLYIWGQITTNTTVALIGGILSTFMFSVLYLHQKKRKIVQKRSSEIKEAQNVLSQQTSKILNDFNPREGSFFEMGPTEELNISILRVLDQLSLEKRHLEEKKINIDNELQGLSENCKTLKKALAHHNDLLRKKEEDLLGLCKRLGLTSIPPQNLFVQYLDTIEQLRDLIGEIHKIDKKIKAEKTGLKSFLDDATSLFEKLGQNLPQEGEIFSELYLLKDRLSDNKTKVALKKELELQLELKAKELKDLKSTLTNQKDELNRILNMVDATNTEEFWSVVEQVKKKRKLLENETLLRLELSQLGEDFDGLYKDEDRDVVRAKLQGIIDELKELETKRDSLLKEEGSLREKIASLSSRDLLQELKTQKEDLERQIEALTKKWAVVQISKAIFDLAKRSFEEKSQPAVLKEGAHYFSLLTGGRYSRIHYEIENGALRVVSHKGQWKGIDELSRGTKEQLFLALRFGYIKTLESQLPLIMDDILVNFDPERTRNAANAILDLARTRQVLFLTCHPETKNVFEEASRKLKGNDIKFVEIGLPLE